MSTTSFEHVEGVIIVTLVVGLVLWRVIHKLASTRPEFRIGAPIAVGFVIRLAAIVVISSLGSLETTLRGGDEHTFLNLARILADQPLGHGDLPHGPYQLHVVLFALQMKLGFLTVGAMRITQVGIAMLGVVLILAAAHDLMNGRAARFAAWIMVFEPASIFFNSELHKEPLMELAAGLIVFGGTKIWQKLDLRGILLCVLGGAIAVETRAYAGWFLVSAAVVLLLAATLRNMNRPMRAMPLFYAVVIAAFLATPVILQASSKKSLQTLQQSQNAHASGTGQASTTGSNGDNLALEQVNLSTRGAIITNLPKRIRDLLLKPYPWQLGDTSQRVGAIGTLFAYAIFLLFLRYAWLSRGAVFRRIAPLLLPFLFMLIAYSLSAGNAGTGFRYRTHLVTLAIAAMAIVREHYLEARAEGRVRVRGRRGVRVGQAMSPAPVGPQLRDA